MAAAQHILISELLQSYRYVFGPVRIVGRLESLEENRIVLEDREKRIVVDVSLVGEISLHVGQWYQFIGEVRPELDDECNEKPVMVARIGRNVEGLDMELYKQAVSLIKGMFGSNLPVLSETPP